MTAELGLSRREKVLEIGTGSGYQTAVLAELAAEVYTVELIPTLLERARALLDELGYRNIRYRAADGSAGWPEEAPFDAILVAAAAPAVPAALTAQLGDNGVLVVPVGRSSGLPDPAHRPPARGPAGTARGNRLPLRAPGFHRALSAGVADPPYGDQHGAHIAKVRFLLYAGPRLMSIPVFRPTLRRRDFNSVLGCLVSDRLGGGPLNHELAAELSRYLGAAGGACLATFGQAVALRAGDAGAGRGGGGGPFRPGPGRIPGGAGRAGPEGPGGRRGPGDRPDPALRGGAPPGRRARRRWCCTIRWGCVPETDELFCLGLPVLEDISQALGASLGARGGGRRPARLSPPAAAAAWGR